MKNLKKIVEELNALPLKISTPSMETFHGGLIDATAPTNVDGQWKIVSGMPGCGKTTLLMDFYEKSIKKFGAQAVAVLAIGERQIEISEDWGPIVPGHHLYKIASDDGMPEALTKNLADIVCKISKDNNYKVVIIDSLSGVYNIISCYRPLEKGGLGAGGLNLRAPNFINNFIIKPLRTRLDNKNGQPVARKEDRIIISSLLYGEEMRDMRALHEKFKALCDSELVLSQQLAQQGIFPAIDIEKSYSRRIEKFGGEKTQKAYKTAKLHTMTVWLKSVKRQAVRL